MGWAPGGPTASPAVDVRARDRSDPELLVIGVSLMRLKSRADGLLLPGPLAS